MRHWGHFVDVEKKTIRLLLGAVKKTCGWHISEANSLSVLWHQRTSFANGAREGDLLGCAETVNQATGAWRRRWPVDLSHPSAGRCVNGGRWNAIDTDAADSDRRPALVLAAKSLGECEQRLYLQHASCYCRTAQQIPEPPLFFSFPGNEWKHDPEKNKKKNEAVPTS